MLQATEHHLLWAGRAEQLLHVQVVVWKEWNE